MIIKSNTIFSNIVCPINNLLLSNSDEYFPDLLSYTSEFGENNWEIIFRDKVIAECADNILYMDGEPWEFIDLPDIKTGLKDFKNNLISKLNSILGYDIKRKRNEQTTPS